MSRLESTKSFVLPLVATVFLFLSGVAIPLAGILLIPLVPQPPLAFSVKYGKGGAIWLLFSASILLLLLGGREAALGYLLLALMVVFLSCCFGRGWSIEAVVVSTATGMVVAASTVLFSLFGSLSRLRQVADSALRENLEISLMIYEKAGFSAETIELARERSSQVIGVILQIMPALAFMGFVAVILINLMLLFYRFPEDRNFFFAIGDLKEWRSPEPLIWCFILSGFSLFLPAHWGLKILGLNLLLIITLFYFFQGLAIVAYFFHHKRVPRLLRGIGYGLIALEQLVTLFVVGLGLFDLWGDFRRLRKRDLNPTQVT
ncbi:MAG: DUF2232 domain-containing protein [Candidatus Binatia bacterium]